MNESEDDGLGEGDDDDEEGDEDDEDGIELKSEDLIVSDICRLFNSRLLLTYYLICTYKNLNCYIVSPREHAKKMADETWEVALHRL